MVIMLTAFMLGVFTEHGYTYYLATYNNFSGSSDAVALANMIYNSATNRFTCVAEERMQAPVVTISTIGFSYWVCTVVQGGVYKWYLTPSPAVNYNASSKYSSWTSPQILAIVGQSRRGTSEGWHDFKNGGSTWAPYTDYLYHAIP